MYFNLRAALGLALMLNSVTTPAGTKSADEIARELSNPAGSLAS
ncbi:MAG: hypothetical protein ABF297_04610 [Thiogranum sp.]